jgi:hypothetical protein
MRPRIGRALEEAYALPDATLAERRLHQLAAGIDAVGKAPRDTRERQRMGRRLRRPPCSGTASLRVGRRETKFKRLALASWVG